MTAEDRRPIEEHPRIVEQRRRSGDREADTAVGRGHRQTIVSEVECKSKLTLGRDALKKAPS
jgi:IS30 family transposase